MFDVQIDNNTFDSAFNTTIIKAELFNNPHVYSISD